MIDVMIIGGGPAGLTAAIYAVRAGLSTCVFEAGIPGGQMANTHWIENYPGFEKGISGLELGEAMKNQAVRLGAQLISQNVRSVAVEGNIKHIEVRKEKYEGRILIIATGASSRKLGIENEDKLAGAGVSYCATCDGGFFKDKTVAVIGGGDTALGDASYLARIAKKVYVIHRRDEFRAAASVRKAGLEHQNVEAIMDSVVEKFEGDTQLERLMLKNVKTGEKQVLELDGAFVAAGNEPRTKLFEDKLVLKNGYIETDQHCLSSVEGVYAIGDVRFGALRQVITGCADGAIAVEAARKYLSLKGC